MKKTEQDQIRKDVNALAKEMLDTCRVLKEAEQPDKTRIGIIITDDSDKSEAEDGDVRSEIDKCGDMV